MTVTTSLVLAGALLTILPATAREAVWRSMPIRSEAEFKLGLPGGEAEQHLQGMCRSVSNPDRLYLSHDVGQVWRSDDNGHSWQHTICEGIYVAAGQSVQVDPVNPDVVMVIMSRAWDYLAKSQQGLYRSEDAGAHWTRVLAIDDVDHQRSMQQAICWDPATVDGTEAKRWFVAFAGNALNRSDDGGRSWAKVSDLQEHQPLYRLLAHPTRPGVLYLTSKLGLFVSEDGGQKFEPLGDLPRGEVRALDINAGDPSDMYATVDGVGLFRSRDSGAHFDQVKEFNAQYVSVHPTDRRRLYLVGRSRAHMLASRDGGATWDVPKVIPIPGWDREKSTWKTHFEGQFSALLPDPRDPDSAVGIANATLWRTDDGGQTFTDSSAGFTGYAWGAGTRPVAFDRRDPNSIAFCCFDVGMVVTHNGGQWFERRPAPWEWKRDKKIRHTGMYAGGYQPIDGSKVMVATVGLYFDQVVIRSDDEGRDWQIVEGTPRNNWFLGFHEQVPKVVYVDNKRSDDAGQTFQVLPNIPADAVIVGLAPTQSDTVYALNKNRTELSRSDDRGETWQLYSKPGWAMRKLDGKPTFLVSPTDPDLVYSIDQRGDLATFDGRTWKSLGVLDLAGGIKEQGNFVRMVAVDPRHPEIVYAATNATGRSYLFRSVDAGTTWQDITGNLPRIGAGGLVVHPLTGDVFCGGICGTRVLAPPYDSPDSLYPGLKPPQAANGA